MTSRCVKVSIYVLGPFNGRDVSFSHSLSGVPLWVGDGRVGEKQREQMSRSSCTCDCGFGAADMPQRKGGAEMKVSGVRFAESDVSGGPLAEPSQKTVHT